MCVGAQPLWLLSAWGFPDDSLCFSGALWSALFTPNPSYALSTFYQQWPKFAGAPTVFSNIGFTAGSTQVTVSSTSGMASGQYVFAPVALPQGALIVSVGNGQITLSLPAGTTTQDTLTVYLNPPVPPFIVQSYLNLAVASLPSGMWQSAWTLAVGLFVAHYVTLYLQSDAQQVAETLQTVIHSEVPQGATPGNVFSLSSAPPNNVLQALTVNGVMATPGTDYVLSGNQITFMNTVPAGAQLLAVWLVPQTVATPIYGTASQVAAAGAANGILLTKAVGDVSAGYQQLEMMQDWGAWALTRYGQQLVTMARAMFSFPVWVY